MIDTSTCYLGRMWFTYVMKIMFRCAILTLSVFCIGSCGKSTNDYELRSADFGADTLHMVEKEMGLKLPSGAKGVNFYYKAPIDPAFLAKIEIPHDAKDDIDQQLSAFPDKPFKSSGGLPDRITWWTPSDGRVVHDRKFFDDHTGQSRRVVLTEKDGKWFLYLDWNT